MFFFESKKKNLIFEWSMYKTESIMVKKSEGCVKIERACFDLHWFYMNIIRLSRHNNIEETAYIRKKMHESNKKTGERGQL